MNEVKLYPEMDDKIVELLRLSDNPADIYAAALIEKLLAEKAERENPKPLTEEAFEFDVIDNKTGECPDLEHIVLNEKWAEGLMYCDMDGFAITEDGALILMDDCGKSAYCPDGRFRVAPRTKPERSGK